MIITTPPAFLSESEGTHTSGKLSLGLRDIGVGGSLRQLLFRVLKTNVPCRRPTLIQAGAATEKELQ